MVPNMKEKVLNKGAKEAGGAAYGGGPAYSIGLDGRLEFGA